MDKKPFVVAAIPAFNEEGTITGVVLLAQRYVDKVIVCDDCSTDLTGEIAEGLDTSMHNPLTHGASVVMSIVRLVVEERPLVFLGWSEKDL